MHCLPVDLGFMGMTLLIYTMAQHLMVANNRDGRPQNPKLMANSITLFVQQQYGIKAACWTSYHPQM